MDANGAPVNVYIDLLKACDNLDHLILFSKLKFYGITGVSLDVMSIATCLIEASVLISILRFPIFGHKTGYTPGFNLGSSSVLHPH